MTKRNWQQHYKLLDSWSIPELAALCCGVDPRLTALAPFERAFSRANVFGEATAFEEATDQVNAGIRAGVLQTIPTTKTQRDVAFKPSEAIPWAAEKYPNSFPYVADEKPLDARERTTLLLIIAALAQHAKLDLSHPSKASQVIAAELEIIGESRDPKTISTHLKAVSFVSSRSRQ